MALSDVVRFTWHITSSTGRISVFVTDALPELWTCPRCGHQFVSRNLWHSCGQYNLDDHFRGKDPVLKETFDRLVEIGRLCGPVKVYAQKTRIVFMVRVRFGGAVVHKRFLDCPFWLTHPVEHPLLSKIEVLGPRIHIAHFRLAHPADIDSALQDLVCEVYKTGKQAHLPGAPAQ